MLGIRHALRISASHWARPRQIPRIAISATGALAGLCVGGVLYAHENTTSPVNTDSTQLPTANLVLEPLSNTLIAPVLRLETKGGPTVFRLIAAGCRKLYLFNVYTMSLYLSDDSMDRLKRSSRWRDEYLPEKWTGTGPGEYYSRDLISNSELAIVIEPVRDTDYQHMKNGFARFLVARFNSQKENLTEEEQSEFTTALNDFKRAFPKGHVAKGARLIFLASNGTISITHEDKPFGTVSSKLFTRYFVEGYINPKFSMSPNFCSKVAQGLCRAE